LTLVIKEELTCTWFVCSVQCESKKSPLRPAVFWHFFTNGWEFYASIFTHLLHVPIYARLQIFIHLGLSQILTKLCHNNRDYLVHIICSKCPPSAETHAYVVDSFVDRCLW